MSLRSHKWLMVVYEQKHGPLPSSQKVLPDSSVVEGRRSLGELRFEWTRLQLKRRKTFLMGIYGGDTPGWGGMTALGDVETGWLFPWPCKQAKAFSAQSLQKHSLITSLLWSFLSPLHTNPINSLRRKASNFLSSVSSNIYQSNWFLKELSPLTESE